MAAFGDLRFAAGILFAGGAIFAAVDLGPHPVSQAVHDAINGIATVVTPGQLPPQALGGQPNSSPSFGGGDHQASSPATAAAGANGAGGTKASGSGGGAGRASSGTGTGGGTRAGANGSTGATSGGGNSGSGSSSGSGSGGSGSSGSGSGGVSLGAPERGTVSGGLTPISIVLLGGTATTTSPAEPTGTTGTVSSPTTTAPPPTTTTAPPPTTTTAPPPTTTTTSPTTTTTTPPPAVLTANASLSSVESTLVALSKTTVGPPPPPLTQAAKDVSTALSPQYWISGDVIAANAGPVFDQTKAAIQALEGIKNAPAAWNLVGLETQLAQAMRLIASTAIADNSCNPQNAGSLTKANAALVQGDTQLVKGPIDSAVPPYKTAWQDALAAKGTTC